MVPVSGLSLVIVVHCPLMLRHKAERSQPDLDRLNRTFMRLSHLVEHPADGKVHPGEPEVVLAAPEVDGVGGQGIEFGEEFSTAAPAGSGMSEGSAMPGS